MLEINIKGDLKITHIVSSARFKIFSYHCECAKSLQLCLTLCDPVDCDSPGSSVHGILQARILEWVAMPSSRGSSRPRDRTCVSYVSRIGRQVFFTTSATWEAHIHYSLSVVNRA